MSLLLHFFGNFIFFVALGAIILTLLTWFTRTSRNARTPSSSGEWPEDKASHVNRISAPYSSSRRDLKDEQERRRA